MPQLSKKLESAGRGMIKRYGEISMRCSSKLAAARHGVSVPTRSSAFSPATSRLGLESGLT
jgi:hypothetical protein